jgi:hypothetical protein
MGPFDGVRGEPLDESLGESLADNRRSYRHRTRISRQEVRRFIMRCILYT